MIDEKERKEEKKKKKKEKKTYIHRPSQLILTIYDVDVYILFFFFREKKRIVGETSNPARPSLPSHTWISICKRRRT